MPAASYRHVHGAASACFWLCLMLDCAVVVSRAFSCLSDSDKRAAFDRYGDEAPTLSRTRSAQEFDPNEIFNAFFGGGGGPFGGGPFQAGYAAMCCQL